MSNRYHPRPTRRQPPRDGAKKESAPRLSKAGARRPGTFSNPKTIECYHMPSDRPKVRASDVALVFLAVALVAAMVWALCQCRALGYEDGHAAGWRDGYAAAMGASAP